ncbi:MAG: hypothetical protein HRF49_09375 [bacterium]|jgi:5-methylcytosine-specific restriction protein A
MSISIARVLVDESEIQEAYKIYDKAVNGCGEKVKNRIGHPGGVTDVSVAWHPDQKFWSFFDAHRCENRFWCCFGIDNPKHKFDLDISCEINIPFKGINRRIAGVFAKTTFGNIALLHSGKLGGGRAGIGREAFLDYYEDAVLVDVNWPDGVFSDLIFVGELQSEEFLAKLCRFVAKAAKFKDWAVGKSRSR